MSQANESAGSRSQIVKHLNDLSDAVRRNPNSDDALNEIRETLKADTSFARTRACVALGKLGPLAQAATPDLIEVLNSDDPFAEREAARALGSTGGKDPRAVNALTAKLAEEQRDVAWFSAESLGKIGRPALSSIPALEIAEKSTSEPMAFHAKAALKKLRKLQ